MSTFESEPQVRVEWTDPETGKKGYLVIHNFGPTGLCTGGTRMRAGCTMSEVEDLARGMALKTATYALPVGGAKGGIDCDPKDPQADNVLLRFMKAMRPYLDDHWVTAEDLGLTQDRLDEVFTKLGLGQSYHAAIQRSDDPEATLVRIQQSMNVKTDDDYKLGDIIGGYGVAQSCLSVAKARGWSIADTTVAIQGIGTMGGGAAWYLHQAGMKIIEVSDARGSLWSLGERLDIPTLLAARNEYGEIDRSQVDESVLQIDRDAILSVEADIFIPAATSYSITADNVNQVQAGVIVEAANAATTHDAELILASNDIPVIPDFVANAGAVAWAWWVLFGQVNTDPEVSFRKLESEMQYRVADLVEAWDQQRIMPRVSAHNAADAAFKQTLDQVIIP